MPELDICCICGRPADTSIYDPVEEINVPFCGFCEASQPPAALKFAVEHYDPDLLPYAWRPQRRKPWVTVVGHYAGIGKCAQCGALFEWAKTNTPDIPDAVVPRCPQCHQGPETVGLVPLTSPLPGT